MPPVHTSKRCRAGFTLVELLVVIGIIALLLALLLPALSKAREQANMVKCMATLRSMAQAAHMHAAEHQGYMPLAGMHGSVSPPFHLGDASMRKYTYYTEFPNRPVPAPMSVALGRYMNLSVNSHDAKELKESLRQESVIRVFTCPQDNNPPTPGSTVASTAGWRSPDEIMSYIVNVAVLGLRSQRPDTCPAGKVSKVGRPAEVFLFTDGKRGSAPEIAYQVFEDEDNWTLYDCWARRGRSGYAAQLDTSRHRRRMNVAFVDGHVETINAIDDRSSSHAEKTKADFERVGVSNGIYR